MLSWMPDGDMYTAEVVLRIIRGGNGPRRISVFDIHSITIVCLVHINVSHG
jgi:hypothetical protein